MKFLVEISKTAMKKWKRRLEDVLIDNTDESDILIFREFFLHEMGYEICDFRGSVKITKFED